MRCCEYETIITLTVKDVWYFEYWTDQRQLCLSLSAFYILVCGKCNT